MLSVLWANSCTDLFRTRLCVSMVKFYRELKCLLSYKIWSTSLSNLSQRALWWTIPAIEAIKLSEPTVYRFEAMQALEFALHSVCLYHKLYQRNFVFPNFRKREFSLLWNFVQPKFRLGRQEISQRSPRSFVSFNESSRVFVRNFGELWREKKDEIRRTSLSILLHSTVIITGKKNGFAQGQMCHKFVISDK